VSVRDPEVLDVEADDREQSRRPIVAGVAAGLWALLVGVALVTCLVMLAWAVSPNSAGDSAAAWRAAGSVWLGAHQVPLEIGDRSLTLLPLGAVLLGLLLTRRGGRWAGRLLPGTTPGEAVGIVTACALVYGAGGAGVAWLAAGPGTGASPPRAFLWTGTVALAGVTWGIAREAELVAWSRARVSDAAWRTALGGLAAVVGLYAVGAVLVTVSLVRHFGQLATTMADLDAGPVGELALTALGALCLPTLDIWGMAVVVGPGFDLGSAGALSAFGGQVGTLPALPILAAVPSTVPAWGPMLMLVPVALGALAGRIRWGRDLPTPTGAVVSGAGLAGVVAALVGGVVLLASGSLGGGRLAEVGPRLLPVASAAAGLVLVGFLAEAAFQSLRLSWQLHQAERRAEERRLRREARGLADPAEGTVAAVDVAIDADDQLGSVERVAELAAESAPRREPRPVRESLVIPVLVAIPEQDAEAEDDDTSSGPVGQDEGRPSPAAPGGDADDHANGAQRAEPPEPGSPDSDVTVDRTADQPADAAPPEVELGTSGDGAVDGDSTVDLTVDPADVAEIRAAQRDRSTGEDPAAGLG
jgi:Family of unknown function (DUF6350)